MPALIFSSQIQTNSANYSAQGQKLAVAQIIAPQAVLRAEVGLLQIWLVVFFGKIISLGCKNHY